jgi:probable F420-dependent oxidoreductase
MTAAAEVTTSLRVLSLVFGNDYRHPVVLHKSMATLDVLSEGRVEIGLGAGWMLEDYQAANLPYDPAPHRVERLEEAALVLNGLFSQDPFSFRGKHYQIEELDGLPKPFQHPHPPLLIGGGGRRVLEVAARVADIVGINPSQPAGAVDSYEALDQTFERVGEKVAWVHEVLRREGRSVDDVELQIRLLSSCVSRSSEQARTMLTALAERMGVSLALLERSPALLYGTVEQCVEALEERRERLGISYVNLTAGNVEDMAPIVARLRGV